MPYNMANHLGYVGMKTHIRNKSDNSLQDKDGKKTSEKYIDAPIHYCDHHYSHACAGFFTSRYNDSAIVVIDAIGEFQTLTIWKAEGNKIKLKYQERYPQSVGLWYSAMTQRCGLKPNEEEYILMGMSAYGDPDRLKRRYKRLNAPKFTLWL